MGVTIEDEKLIRGLYPVDIYIPVDINATFLSKILPSEELRIHYETLRNGFIVEIHGPSHYDSYSKVRHS